MTTTPIHLIGNLVEDPELRFTPSGAAVANFRVASTPRKFDRAAGEFVDGETMFLTCSVWREQAENVAETLRRGMRVLVIGKLKARTYQNQAGENRTVFEVDVDEVGPSLRYAHANVEKTPRAEAGSRPPARRNDTGDAGDPWNPKPARRDDNDPWLPRTQASQPEEPPF